MAKGKHAPSKGAVRKDKVIHPCSRKAARLNHKEQRKIKMSTTQKVGGIRLQMLGEKLLWFHDNLELFLDSDDAVLTKEAFLDLVNGYLARFTDELEQIEIKNSIGCVKNRRLQHASRKDVIDLTVKTEKDEFEGCGLELPDLFDAKALEYFQDWNGELRFVQNIKVRRFKKKELTEEQKDGDEELTDEQKEGVEELTDEETDGEEEQTEETATSCEMETI